MLGPFRLSLSLQLGEALAPRKDVAETEPANGWTVEDSAVVFNVPPKCSLEPACGDALALLAMAFAVHGGRPAWRK